MTREILTSIDNEFLGTRTLLVQETVSNEARCTENIIEDNMLIKEMENILRDPSYVNDLAWCAISQDCKLSERFIRKFQDKINWEIISTYQILSEDFIREFQDKVDWDAISSDQRLSENFIREFQDKVNWYYISFYQKLSKEFRKTWGLE